MAKTAAQLAAEAYEKQKRQNRYGTTGGYTVSKPNPVDKSQQAAQIYQQQKNSGIYQTTSGRTVKSPSKSIGSSGGSRTIPSVTMPIIKTATVPTKKYSPVRPTPNTDVSGIDQSKVAAAAYRQKQAAYRKANEDEEYTAKNPDTGIGYSGPTAMGTFSSMLTKTPAPGQDSSATFGLAQDKNYEYKTYAQQKAEAEAARKEQERAYQQWLAQQQTVEQPVVEEVVEEELDPMEDYWQAIIDAQNAQYAAMNQALRNQQVGLNGLYDQNAADLYAQYVRSGLVLPEQMAGMATGAADSMLLQNDLNYQNNLNKNELERIAGLADLESQMAQNQAAADLQAAETAAEWAKMAYQQRLAEQEAEREYNLALAKANNNKSNTASKPSLTASQAMNAWENGYDTPEIRAALQYHYGYVPDNGGAVNSGANSVSAQSADLGAGLANGSGAFGIVDTKAYYVPGLGRMSGAEVKRGIQSGQIDVYKQGSDYFFRKA